MEVCQNGGWVQKAYIAQISAVGEFVQFVQEVAKDGEQDWGGCCFVFLTMLSALLKDEYVQKIVLG